jgi:16S rRNA (guanine966-N2)-methyltransferase
VRIIGGRWRGRRLRLCGAPGLRPTPDRVRETVFNWLQSPLPGARCLDLFAGSGALGLEALSRGAAEVVFVERNVAIARRLQDNLALLEAVSGRLERTDALIWLRRKPEFFDIIFLDPPFGRNLLEPTCMALESGGWLRSRAWIYLESEVALKTLRLPSSWELVRDNCAGDVRYRLALRGD